MCSSASSILPSLNNSSTRRRVSRMTFVNWGLMSSAGAYLLAEMVRSPPMRSNTMSPSSRPMMSATVSFMVNIVSFFLRFLPSGLKKKKACIHS